MVVVQICVLLIVLIKLDADLTASSVTPYLPPRVILSGGRSPQSNPEGVCVAQDLRGANKI